MDKVEQMLEAKQSNNSLNGPDRVPTLNKHIFNKCTEKARQMNSEVLCKAFKLHQSPELARAFLSDWAD